MRSGNTEVYKFFRGVRDVAIGKEALLLEAAIGYHFSDVGFLECALTHSSYSNEQRSRGIELKSNERLEFLGDAVLQMVISEYLYSNFSKYREGALTKMRQQLVCENTLANVASRISLGDYLNLGRGEELTDCRVRPKILADALEALIAAVYLDSSDERTCRELILTLFEDEINSVSTQRKTDYKTVLQQFIEQDGTSQLEYRVIEESGPEHDKTFTVVAYINNNEVGKGTASTKKNAEMQAARAALSLFGVLV